LTQAEGQSSSYATSKLKHLNNDPLPFVYKTTGTVTRFTDYRDPKPRSRPVFTFHKPETFREWLKKHKSCAGAADHRGLSSQCPRGAGVMIRANRPAYTIPNWLNIFISVSLDLMNSFSNAGSKNRKLTGCSRMSDSHFVCLMIEALRSKLRKIFDSQGKNLKHDSLAYPCSKLQEMRSLPNSASGGLNKWIDQITSEIQY